MSFVSVEFIGHEVVRDAAAHAKAAHLGIWSGSFILPWEWREKFQTTDQTISPEASQEAAACRIKGNISSKGERIYHVPGGKWYDETIVDESKGERWFCSAAEAIAAGWRPSKR